MAILKAENLSLKNGSKYILKDLNWEVKPGENWVLFGLNGCGKTTLLSILAGYKSGNFGETYLFDQLVGDENFIALRKNVGFVSSSFFDRYLQKEIILDIVLAGKYGTLGFQQEEPSDKDVRQAKAVLREFGLDKRSRYPYDTLSKGQQQRVLIARALMGEPKVLMLDEPCSGLDIFARENFLHMIQELAEQKQITIVYVTHHTEEILPFFDKAALMRDGRLHSQGDLQEIFTEENLTDFFGTKATVLWTEQHFFINIEFASEHHFTRKFKVLQ